jgi:hypothetical protein
VHIGSLLRLRWGNVWATKMLEGMATGIAATRRQRTRLTNGIQLLPHIDGRCSWAGLMKDVYAAVAIAKASAGSDGSVT